MNRDNLKPSKGAAQQAVVQHAAPIAMHPVGTIRTPYTDNAPYQPVNDDPGEFYIEIFPQYQAGLLSLERFAYCYLIYHTHRAEAAPQMRFNPPWVPDTRIGLFASRSPLRPNRIGLSVVGLKRIEGTVVYTTGLDVFDGTPLLDIKPYIRDLDVKTDANFGWLEDLDHRDHFMLHIRGIPHDY